MFTRLLWHGLLSRLAALLSLFLPTAGLEAASAAAWVTRTWQTDEGLPDNVVVGIAQTPDGFLWVATQGGLVRFDGIQFRDFPPVTEAGVPSGLLHGLTVDRQGRLWVTKDRGVVVCVDRGETTSFVLQQGSPNARAITPVEDGSGDIWAAYPTLSSRVVRLRDGQATYFGEQDGLPPGRICLLTRDSQRQIWCGVGDTLTVLREGTFQTRTKVPEMQSIAPARNSGIWIGSGTRLFRYTDEAGLIHAGDLPAHSPGVKTSVSVLLEDSGGRLWIGTSEQGLFCLEGGAVRPRPASHREILSLAEDREGNLWVGTRGGGLNRMRPSIVESQDIASGLPFEAVRSVCQTTDGTLWAVARSGVVARQQGAGWTSLGPANGWTIKDAMSVVPATNGSLWIGTHNNGLFLWNQGVIASFSTNDGLAGNFARSLLSHTNGDLWIGTSSGIGLHRLRGKQLRRFALPVESGLVRAMALDSSGAFWAGTADGALLRVIGDSVEEETGRLVPRLQTIRCLHAGDDGSLWIGYGGTGVGRLKNERFQVFRAEDGNVDDYISQIMHDRNGRLWFAGNKGIFTIPQGDFEDPVSERRPHLRPTLFGREEGLPALQASREAWPGIVRASDGRLWIAMQTGLAVVNTHAIATNPSPPSVVIERVSLDGELAAAYDSGITSSQSTKRQRVPVRLQRAEGLPLQVPPGRTQIEIEFAAVGLTSPRSTAVRYRLEGLDTEWTDAGARRVAYYSHLPPGSYHFRAAASVPPGPWSETRSGLRLEVLPQFWQALWFRSLVGLSLLVAAGAAARYAGLRRLTQRVEQAEQESGIERERSRIAKDIHDDLGASLTEITLLSELAQGGDVSSEEVQRDLRRIAERTRHLTRALDTTVWAVNPRNDTLESLVTYTCNQASDFLESVGIRCRLDVAETLPATVLTAAIRHNVVLIVKEALHNVVKHASATEVVLRISADQDTLALSLEDDGAGFATDPRRSNPFTVEDHPGAEPKGVRLGNGLRNMRKRAQDIGGRLQLEARPEGGTRVRVTVPIRAG